MATKLAKMRATRQQRRVCRDGNDFLEIGGGEVTSAALEPASYIIQKGGKRNNRNNFPVSPSGDMKSAAETTLIRRAVSCSFSSIFHLKNSGMPPKQFRSIARSFTVLVIGPLLVFGAVGVFKVAQR